MFQCHLEPPRVDKKEGKGKAETLPSPVSVLVPADARYCTCLGEIVHEMEKSRDRNIGMVTGPWLDTPCFLESDHAPIGRIGHSPSGFIFPGQSPDASAPSHIICRVVYHDLEKAVLQPCLSLFGSEVAQ